MGGYKQT